MSIVGCPRIPERVPRAPPNFQKTHPNLPPATGLGYRGFQPESSLLALKGRRARNRAFLTRYEWLINETIPLLPASVRSAREPRILGHALSKRDRAVQPTREVERRERVRQFIRERGGASKRRERARNSGVVKSWVLAKTPAPYPFAVLASWLAWTCQNPRALPFCRFGKLEFPDWSALRKPNPVSKEDCRC